LASGFPCEKPGRVSKRVFSLTLVIRHTGTDRLLDEQHAGEVGPAVLVLNRFGCASHPAEGLMINVIASLPSILSGKKYAIFLQQSFKR